MNRFGNFTNNLSSGVTGGAVTVSAVCSACGSYGAC